jgi:PAS domain S-box-containing protein
VLSTGAGVLLRAAFDTAWESRLPYIMFFPAVMLSSYVGGVGPGILTTVLSAAAASYFWLTPRGSLVIADPGQALGMLVFVIIGISISFLNAKWRRDSLALAESEKRLAQALEIAELQDRSARELAAIVASSDDAIVSKDLHSVVRSWNRGAERMFGYSAEEMIGNSIRIIIPEERWGEEDDVLKQLARGQKVDHFETIRRRKDGTTLPVSLTISPIYSAAGMVVGASKIARDISERLQVAAVLAELLRREQDARQEVERASHLKDDFLAVVSHELRTPLNAVLGYAQLLTSGALSADRERHALEAIRRNAKAQARLVESLLDISRVLAGKLDLNIESLTLTSVLEASADAVRPDAEARGIAFSLATPPTATPIMLSGDGARLQQVFWNLFSNAIKFTPRAGRVVVMVSVGEADVRVEVADTGQGMSADLLPHIFDRFRQATGEAARGGLGLGLSLVKEIVYAHGGAVSASSEGEGRGSTFTVTLPLASASTSPTPNVPERNPATAAMLSTVLSEILVVDDERDAREMLTLTLTTRGARVRTAASAAEAFNAMTSRRPDVLLADLGMPDEDGYSLIRRWRSHERQGQSGHVPAIAVTAYAAPKDRERAVAAGFDGHIAKPIDLDELIRAITAITSRSNSARLP